MSNKDINQVLPRETRDVADAVTIELVKAFAECGLNVNEPDMKKFHKEMKEKGVHVQKLINGTESGYHVIKNGLVVKFIPTVIVKGIVI